MATSWAESIPSRSNAWPCSLAGFAIGGKTWSALPGSDVAVFEEQAVEAVVPAINGLPRSLAQLMFEDDDRDGAEAQRNLPVEPARVSESARAKADAKCTLDGLPVRDLATLLTDLATPTPNEAPVPAAPDHGVRS